MFLYGLLFMKKNLSKISGVFLIATFVGYCIQESFAKRRGGNTEEQKKRDLEKKCSNKCRFRITDDEPKTPAQEKECYDKCMKDG